MQKSNMNSCCLKTLCEEKKTLRSRHSNNLDEKCRIIYIRNFYLWCYFVYTVFLWYWLSESEYVFPNTFPNSGVIYVVKLESNKINLFCGQFIKISSCNVIFYFRTNYYKV